MSGFNAGDVATIGVALDDYMPSRAVVTRPTYTRVKGDYTPTTPVTIGTNVHCRILPLTATANTKLEMKFFPVGSAEQAQYFIALQTGYDYKQGDIVTADGVDYRLIAVRYDNSSWIEVVRAMGVRNE